MEFEALFENTRRNRYKNYIIQSTVLTKLQENHWQIISKAHVKIFAKVTSVKLSNLNTINTS